MTSMMEILSHIGITERSKEKINIKKANSRMGYAMIVLEKKLTILISR